MEGEAAKAEEQTVAEEEEDCWRIQRGAAEMNRGVKPSLKAIQ